MSALRALVMLVLAGVLSGCGYNTIQQKDEAVKAAWAEVLSQYQRRADLIPNIVNTVKARQLRADDTAERDRGARPRDVDPGHARADQRSGSVRALHAGAGPGDERAVAAARDGGELPEPEGEPGLPGPARAARGHREPHRHRAQPLHQGGRGLQRLHPPAAQNLTRWCSLQAAPAIRGGERSGDQQAADVDFGTKK